MYRLILVLALSSTAAPGATYTVATNGNDANAGTEVAPFRTIAKGVATARAGDTVQVRGGTYNEAVTLWQSGTAAAPIKVQAYPGEVPVIDGQMTRPGDWGALLTLGGNYIDVSGIEVMNSRQYGVQMSGHHNAIRRMNIHHASYSGVNAAGDYSLVEDSRVWQTSRSNVNGSSASGWGAGLTASRDPVDGITDGAILRRNVVFNNWGEGLSTFEANGTVIEDNTVYDNWAQNFYISDARNVLAQRNLVYTTANNAVGKRAGGIMLADERSDKPRSTGNRVINNLLLDAGICGFCWSIVPGATLDNSVIAHNTLVNGGVSAGPVSGNTRVANNLQNAVVVGGASITPEYFRLKSASPVAAIGEVPQDFFKATRPVSTTMGAIEFGVVAPPPPEPVYPAFSVNVYQKGAQVQQVPVSGDEIRIVPK